MADAEAGAKVVPRAYAEEKVGVFAVRGGRYGVCEYSELPPALASAGDAGGELLFNAANIVLHYYSFPFLQRCASREIQDKIFFHEAHKKIPCVDGAGASRAQLRGHRRGA